MPFRIFESEARSILSPVSGFLREAGFDPFTEPLPQLYFRLQLLLRAHHARAGGAASRRLDALGSVGRPSNGTRRSCWRRRCGPARRFTARRSPIPTSPRRLRRDLCRTSSGPLRTAPKASSSSFRRAARWSCGICRCCAAFEVTKLRVSFSVTTDREDVRRIFEPHCAPVEERWGTLACLRDAGVEAFATLSPILPCDPEALVQRALEVTAGPVIADPFHVRSVKRSGATTRDPAHAICRRHGWTDWLDPDFQKSVLARMARVGRGRAAVRLRSARLRPARAPGINARVHAILK